LLLQEQGRCAQARTIRGGPPDPLIHVSLFFISNRACVCMHAQTEMRAKSATQSVICAASSIASLCVRHAAMLHRQSSTCTRYAPCEPGSNRYSTFQMRTRRNK
jgi:hypothetical protein